MVELNYQLEYSIRPLTRKFLLNQYKYLEDRSATFHFNLSDELLNGIINEEFLKLEQTDVVIERLCCEAVQDLFNMKVEYAEIAIAPYLHTRHGLTQRNVVDAAICGMSRGLSLIKKTGKFKCKLTLSILRGVPSVINDETVQIAASYKKSGIVGINVMGASNSSITNMANTIKWIKNDKLILNIPCYDPTDYSNALDLGPQRIQLCGDCKDEMILARMKQDNLLVISNVSKDIQSGAQTLLSHPITNFMKHGITVVPCLGDRRFYTKPGCEIILLRDKLRVSQRIIQTNESIALKQALSFK